ncbi:class I SAM-dependent methyltransferase [Loigolactobacillus iwatensis]|uniref:class I SAM-dependent methyltransferase n=1 Tax=Loigolactobacillus iwatensis TaxID=1267156 RepID=UPI0013DE583D|nr:class I SAM-dependent methyltransferase [Loigolactobacillus iwatensis]
MDEEEEEVAAFWDDFADSYIAAQRESQVPIVRDVIQTLQSQLTDQIILDVAAGAGRFALPFASSAKKVILSDISKNMLAYADQVATKQQLTKLSFRHEAWSNLKQKRELADVVFVNMAPFLKADDLAALTKLARKTVVISRVIQQKDVLLDYLLEGISDPSDEQRLMATYEKWLNDNKIDYQQQIFHYAVHEQVGRQEIWNSLVDELNFKQQQLVLRRLDQCFKGKTVFENTRYYDFKLIWWRRIR